MPAPKSRSPGRTRRIVVIAAASMTLCGLFAGCDTPANQSDVSARAQVQQGRDLLATGGDVDEARRLLESAANTATDATTRVGAKALLGQVLMKEARDLSWEVDRLDRDAQRLATEITQLAGQVQLSAQLADGYRQLNPAPVIEQLSQRTAEARGGADRAVWFESDGVAFPSLAAASQEISRLEGDIAARQEQIRQLESQRVAALRAADEAAGRAEAAGGRESVEAFTQSSNARKQASDLATRIDLAKGELRPIQEQLAIANAQKQYVSNAAQQLEEQSRLLAQGWESIQRSGAQQLELARRIASATGEAVTLQPIDGVDVRVLPAGSIAEKASKLAEISTESDQKRQRLIELLNDAAKHLGDAAQSAVTERGAILAVERGGSDAPPGRVEAWKSTRNALSPGMYQVEQAEAFRMLAATHQNHAAMLQARVKSADAARSALTNANLPVPESLQNGGLMERYTAAVREADAAYKEADDLLDTVIKGNAELPNDQAAVAVARPKRLFGLYRWSSLATDMGDTAAAKAHLDSARNEIADALSQNVRLPRLPPELQAMVDAAPRPAPQPEQPDDAPPEPPPQPDAGEQPVEPPAEPQPDQPPGDPG